VKRIQSVGYESEYKMNLNLYFLRHGQTPQSREDVFCGSGLDPELTPEGIEIAHAFANAYGDADWRAVYSSSLRRSIMTAQPLCDALGLDLQTRAELNEIAYGRWEGLTKEKVNQDYHDEYISWLADPAWHAPTGGELAVVIARRGLQIIQEIQQHFTDGNVLLVSHKATIRIILCNLLGIDVGRFRYRLVCPVGSVSIIEFTVNGPLLRAQADRSHLTEDLRSLRGT
jgi:broad specificity phosphatase PhoE